MNPAVKSGCKSKRLFCSAKNFQKFFSPFFRFSAYSKQHLLKLKQLTLFFTYPPILISPYNEHRLKAAANVRGFVNHDTHEMKFSADFYSLQNKSLKTKHEQHYVNVKKEANKKKPSACKKTN